MLAQTSGTNGFPNSASTRKIPAQSKAVSSRTLLLTLIGLFRADGLFQFQITLTVAVYPTLQLQRGFLDLIAVEQTSSKRFEECARPDVVRELVVSLVRRP